MPRQGRPSQSRPLVRADEITHALSKLSPESLFLTEVKTGPTHYVEKGDLQKLDALAIKKSWANPCFSGYEIKVSRSDFLQDDKWPNYLNYCHRFYFACPAQLIQPHEVAPQVGLIWYNPETRAISVRKAALYRSIPMPYDMLYYIIMSKLHNDRHPFFSAHRQLIEAYMQDKEQKRTLGRSFRSKMIQHLEQQKEAIEALEVRVKRAEETAGEHRELLDAVRSLGIDTWYLPRTITELRERVQNGLNPQVRTHIERARRELESAAKIVQPPDHDVENQGGE